MSDKALEAARRRAAEDDGRPEWPRVRTVPLPTQWLHAGKDRGGTRAWRSDLGRATGLVGFLIIREDRRQVPHLCIQIER